MERVRRVASNAAFFGPKSHGEIWRYLGSADVGAGQPGQAVRSYLHSIEADPDERMTYRMVAGLLIDSAKRSGRGVEAGIEEYRIALVRQRHRSGYGDYGIVFAALLAGREDLSLAAAARMVEEEPRNPEMLATYGDFLRRAGQDPEARRLYNQALAIDPNQVRALLGLGCLAGIAGNRTELERCARQALLMSPWSPQAQQFVNRLNDPAAWTPEHCRTNLYIR
jgi:tetratricopeptide (TPR) repeat protein